MARKGDDAITVHRLGKEVPVRFAASELKRYLKKMSGRPVNARAAASYCAGAKGIWVGTADAFPGVVPAHLARREHPFDDAVFVNARGGHVVVAGVNPRSVVFAAYRYLEELGCRWLRPGREGERVPGRANPLAKTVALAEAPSYRHRCICIEGSCSEEHVRSMIDYAAKRSFNAYFFQFRNSFVFFDRWYSKDTHLPRKPGTFSEQEASAICDRLKAQLRKRGMIAHMVGHGWTTESLGIKANQWTQASRPPASARKFFAQIGGKRELFHGVPVNTQLCYSNPKARTIMAREVAGYAEAHPDEEVIHVWLADGSNNFCECPNCRNTRPSEFYVMMLNEIDEMLSRKNLSTRIVFLAYVDLLWAPTKQRIKNQDRFILMFAPITRSYTKSFLEDTRSAEKIGPYVCNKLVFPSSPRANLKLLDGWLKHFKGDCVDFDYHLYRDHNLDPGQTALAEVLFEDVSGLDRLGMNGFISCQITRICFPTGLYMHAMGKGLWEARKGYGRLVDEYFADVFGRQGAAAKNYLKGITRLFDPPLLRGEKKDEASRKKALRSFAHVAALVQEFRPTIEKGCRAADKTTAAAWKIMRDHAWYVRSLAQVYEAAYRGDAEKAVELCGKCEQGLDRRQPRLHHVLDGAMTKIAMRLVLHNQGIKGIEV